jgi:hypothetical protein
MTRVVCGQNSLTIGTISSYLVQRLFARPRGGGYKEGGRSNRELQLDPLATGIALADGEPKISMESETSTTVVATAELRPVPQSCHRFLSLSSSGPSTCDRKSAVGEIPVYFLTSSGVARPIWYSADALARLARAPRREIHRTGPSHHRLPVARRGESRGQEDFRLWPTTRLN